MIRAMVRPASIALALLAVIVGGPSRAHGKLTASDTVLIYQGGTQRPAWTAAQLAPYVTVRDASARGRVGGERWLFDGFLFLELQDGRRAQFVDGRQLRPATRADWSGLLDRLFAPAVALDALDVAVAAATARLGPPPRPRQVVLALPEPVRHQKDWGALDGRALDFDLPADRLAAARWYLDELLRRWQARAPRHLTLAGIYWTAEDASNGRPFLPALAAAVHDAGLDFVWIPYWTSVERKNWRALGFDRAWLQPNHFFTPALPDSRLDDAVAAASADGLGLAVELDGRAWSEAPFRGRAQAYLRRYRDAGVLAHTPLAWYEGGGALLRATTSSDPAAGALYREIATVVAARQRHPLAPPRRADSAQVAPAAADGQSKSCPTCAPSAGSTSPSPRPSASWPAPPTPPSPPPGSKPR